MRPKELLPHIPYNSSLPKDRILELLTIVFPVCKQGLEIECGDGHRIMVARRRHQNYYGIDTQDRHEDWEKKNVGIYCKQMNVLDIPYEENSFDIVMWNNKVPDMPKDEMIESLKIIKKICSYKAFLTFPLTEEKTKEWWIHTLINLGFVIYCLHKSAKDQIITELRAWTI